jgi:predicted phage-related endonuclease
MENVKRRRPPAPDFSESASKCIGKLYPKETGGTVDLGEEMIEIIAGWEKFKAVISQAEKDKKDLENRIKMAIGDNSFARLPDGTRLSYLTTERSGFTVQPTSFRVLRKLKS